LVKNPGVRCGQNSQVDLANNPGVGRFVIIPVVRLFHKSGRPFGRNSRGVVLPNSPGGHVCRGGLATNPGVRFGRNPRVDSLVSMFDICGVFEQQPTNPLGRWRRKPADSAAWPLGRWRRKPYKIGTHEQPHGMTADSHTFIHKHNGQVRSQRPPRREYPIHSNVEGIIVELTPWRPSCRH